GRRELATGEAHQERNEDRGYQAAAEVLDDDGYHQHDLVRTHLRDPVVREVAQDLEKEEDPDRTVDSHPGDHRAPCQHSDDGEDESDPPLNRPDLSLCKTDLQEEGGDHVLAEPIGQLIEDDEEEDDDPPERSGAMEKLDERIH